MSLDIQFKIKNNPYYLRYIRENSDWYKILNRYPENFSVFEERVKETYKLRTSDKIERAFETFELLQNLFSTFK